MVADAPVYEVAGNRFDGVETAHPLVAYDKIPGLHTAGEVHCQHQVAPADRQIDGITQPDRACRCGHQEQPCQRAEPCPPAPQRQPGGFCSAVHGKRFKPGHAQRGFLDFIGTWQQKTHQERQRQNEKKPWPLEVDHFLPLGSFFSQRSASANKALSVLESMVISGRYGTVLNKRPTSD